MKNDPSSQSYEQQRFEKLDIVWAKITGYPWWPAQISQVPSTQDGKYRVDFIGDASHAFLSWKKLVDYADWKDEYSTPKKSPPKNFYLACTAADKLFEQSSDNKIRFLSHFEESQHPKVKQNQIIIELSSQNNQQDKFLPETGKKQDLDSFPKKSSIEFSQILFKTDQATKSPKKTKNKSCRRALEREVSELMEKYCLNKLQQKKPKSGKLALRKKKQSLSTQGVEDNDQLDEKEIKLKLGKKIYKILKTKLKNGKKRKPIALFLLDQFVQENVNNLELSSQNFSRLLNWIQNSGEQEIQEQYQTWKSR